MWKDIVDSLLEVEIAGQPTWILRSQFARLDEFSDSPTTVRLLAGFGTYLLSYLSSDMFVNPCYSKRINTGGSMIRPGAADN